MNYLEKIHMLFTSFIIIVSTFKIPCDITLKSGSYTSMEWSCQFCQMYILLTGHKRCLSRLLIDYIHYFLARTSDKTFSFRVPCYDVFFKLRARVLQPYFLIKS